MVGTPAYEAGIMAGDIIVKVDGKSTENMLLKHVVETITGEPGTKVMLSVVHVGAKTPVDIELTRAEIRIDSVLGDHRQKDNEREWDFWIEPESRIAYVRVVAFTETTVSELTKVVDGLQKANMRGLVLDLRGNPGGLLKSAVEVSSMFLDEGKNVVSTKGRGNVQEDIYNARRIPQLPPAARPYPIAVLLNQYSASASEIVAAALQDHFRAVVVGERSFGKGSVQNIIAMESGATALKLTTASYWRPSGKNIHRFPDSKDDEDWGVKPNKGLEVKLSDEERIDYFRWRRLRDVVRRNADAPKTKEEEKLKDFRDRVLDKAVEYINGELKKQQDARAPQTPPTTTVHEAFRPEVLAAESRVAARRGDAAAVTRER
jgi:carboxyl-terminal processing protease